MPAPRVWLRRLAVGLAAASAVSGVLPTPARSDPTGCAGVRPGAPLLPVPASTLDPRSATIGFIFHGDDGNAYASTAGHVALGLEQGERVWPSGNGVAMFDVDGRRIGEFVYAINTRGSAEPSPSRGTDLALIRVDEGVAVEPSVCGLGGPTGIDMRTIPAPEPVPQRWYGTTFLGGRVGPPLPAPNTWIAPSRAGVSLGMPDPHLVNVIGHASFGDSGAPVLAEGGGAVGLVSGPPQSAEDVRTDGHVGDFVVTRIAPAIARASAMLHITLALATG